MLGHLQGSALLHLRRTVMDPLSLRDRVAIAKRRPVRITITISFALHQRVITTALEQGRSASNLCAHLLEVGLPQQD